MVTFAQMQLKLINTGGFWADGGAMFGAIPKSAWQRRYPCNRNNGCLLAMHCLLVITDCGRIILVDTGVGNKHHEWLKYYRFDQLADLGEELKKAGVHPFDVTDVIFTHLHFDHCGYATQTHPSSGQMEISFPNAVHWVSKEQWERLCNPHPLEQASFLSDNVQAVFRAGLLRTISTDTTLCPGIELRLYHGHTTGQIAPYIHTPEREYVFAGDVVPLAACLSPQWISAYDTLPLVSYDEKLRMLSQAVTKKQALIYCHDAYTPCSTVKKAGGSFKTDSLLLL